MPATCDNRTYLQDPRQQNNKTTHPFLTTFPLIFPKRPRPLLLIIHLQAQLKSQLPTIKYKISNTKHHRNSPIMSSTNSQTSTATLSSSQMLGQIAELKKQMSRLMVKVEQEQMHVQKRLKSNPSINIDECKHDIDLRSSLIDSPVSQCSSPSYCEDDNSLSKICLSQTREFLGIVREKSVTMDEDKQRRQHKDHAAKNNFLDTDPDFESIFQPSQMRLLALVSHNNMKHSMKQFVLANKNVLKKFRLTGTNTTMTMLKDVFGNDPDVVYGPSCKSGPLGGDAQLVAMAATGELGGCIFFVDPMDAHPHSADIACLNRQGNVHNILMMNNPASAHTCLNSLRMALMLGRIEMMPSFFFDLESPSVEAYRKRQQQVLQQSIQHQDAPSPKSILHQRDIVRRSFKQERKRSVRRASSLSHASNAYIAKMGACQDDTDICTMHKTAQHQHQKENSDLSISKHAVTVSSVTNSDSLDSSSIRSPCDQAATKKKSRGLKALLQGRRWNRINVGIH